MMASSGVRSSALDSSTKYGVLILASMLHRGATSFHPGRMDEGFCSERADWNVDDAGVFWAGAAQLMRGPKPTKRAWSLSER